MPTQTFQSLQDQWKAGGKRPVVLFSSAYLKGETPLVIQMPQSEAHPEFLVPTFVPVEQVSRAIQSPQKSVFARWGEQLTNLSVRLPDLQLPTIPKFPSISVPDIRVPALDLPSVSLPRIQAPTLPELPNFGALFQNLFSKRLEAIREWFFNLPWQRILHWGSVAAYGGAVAAVVLFFAPIVLLEGQAQWRKISSHIASTRLQSQVVEPAPTPLPGPEITNVNDYFSLEIPSLDISSRVIPNVNAGDPKDYEDSLKIGIAHAAGTGLPGDTNENKTIYFFAHSTNGTFNIQRYNAQFYALKDTKPGDIIKVRYWGEDYWYAIEETKIVEADDVSYLQPQTDREQLVLQTCYPPGTTWKRLIVIAVPVEASNEDTVNVNVNEQVLP